MAAALFCLSPSYRLLQASKNIFMGICSLEMLQPLQSHTSGCITGDTLLSVLHCRKIMLSCTPFLRTQIVFNVLTFQGKAGRPTAQKSPHPMRVRSAPALDTWLHVYIFCTGCTG